MFCISVKPELGGLPKRKNATYRKVWRFSTPHGHTLFSVFAGGVRLACSSGILLASSAVGLEDRVHPARPSPVGVEKSRLGGSDAVFTGTDFVCLGNGSPETIELRLRSGKRVNYRPVASRRNRRIAGYFSSHLRVRATAPTKKFSLCGRLVAGYSRDQRNLCMASRPRFASMASIHTTG